MPDKVTIYVSSLRWGSFFEPPRGLRYLGEWACSDMRILRLCMRDMVIIVDLISHKKTYSSWKGPKEKTR